MHLFIELFIQIHGQISWMKLISSRLRRREGHPLGADRREELQRGRTQGRHGLRAGGLKPASRPVQGRPSKPHHSASLHSIRPRTPSPTSTPPPPAIPVSWLLSGPSLTLQSPLPPYTHLEWSSLMVIVPSRRHVEQQRGRRRWKLCACMFMSVRVLTLCSTIVMQCAFFIKRPHLSR